MAEEVEATQRKWLVSFTARRKIIRYERQDIAVEVTEEQFYKHFHRKPADTEGETMQIEQLAADIGDPEESLWLETAEYTETLDEINFVVTETL